jgi:hypothetical protein
MSRNVLHIFYIAIAVFVAIMSTVACARPLSARARSTSDALPRRDTVYMLETKYIFVPFKEAVSLIDQKK